MKLKALSIAFFAMLLASCGNSQSTTSNSNKETAPEKTSNIYSDGIIVVDDPEFTDDLKGYCKIDLSSTPTVEIKKEEDGNLIKYSLDLAIIVEKNMDINDLDNLSVATVLWDKNGDTIGLFHLSEESKEKLANTLIAKGKTILTFCAYKDKEGEGLPLENANRVHIAWDDVNIYSDSTSEQSSETYLSDKSDFSSEYPETVDMEMEGDI